jgi:hypothetical protein
MRCRESFGRSCAAGYQVNMNQVESAIKHVHDEFGVEYIAPSLKAEFDILQDAHDAIHEFMYLAPLCFPDDESEISWKNKSAFLLYHLEVFNHAHRSSIEALCTYYNAAFVLLRTTLELLLKGAFWECLSHKKYRSNSSILDKSTEGNKIKDLLRAKFEESSNLESGLEQVPARIFDIIGNKIEDKSFRLSFKTMIQQLDRWGMFSPMTNITNLVYDELYSKLSADIHVIPDRIDIGRRIASEGQDLFEQQVIPAVLKEFAMVLHEIMDVAIVIELNILQDFVVRFESVKPKLLKRVTVIEQLGLKYSLLKMRELLK